MIEFITLSVNVGWKYYRIELSLFELDPYQALLLSEYYVVYLIAHTHICVLNLDPLQPSLPAESHVRTVYLMT